MPESNRRNQDRGFDHADLNQDDDYYSCDDAVTDVVEECAVGTEVFHADPWTTLVDWDPVRRNGPPSRFPGGDALISTSLLANGTGCLATSSQSSSPSLSPEHLSLVEVTDPYTRAYVAPEPV